MFKKIAVEGKYFNTLARYSQASVRKKSPSPMRTLPLISPRFPPTIMVGEKGSSLMAVAIMEVVVVFPWVPETAMETWKFFMTAPRKVARSTTSIFFATAARYSGLSI